jgi:Chlorophyll A-B binding protein
MLDGASQERFDRLRYVEIKHGRIAMLAVLGHIHTAFGARVPGNIDYSGTSFASIKTGIAGLKDIPTAGILQIVAFIGFLELFVMKDKGAGEYPGDLRNGMFAWNASEEEQLKKRAIELNNGRAAQMGILGLMVHEMLNGEPYVINALCGNPSNFNAGL